MKVVIAGRMLPLARLIGALLILASIVAIYRQWQLNPTTAAVTFLLFILIVAAKWGWRFGIVMAFATACFLNYFFLPPVGSFTVADPQNLVALAAFLATGIFGSRLANRMRAEAQTARARQRDVEILFNLSRELLQTEKVTELLDAIPRCVGSATGAQEVALYLEQTGKIYRSDPYSKLALDAEWLRGRWDEPGVRVLGGQSWNIVPLHVGVTPRGLLLLKIDALSSGVRNALGSVVSIAMERARALEGAAHSEATKESERLRAVLLDSITHELRTPLTAIKASASALLSTRDIDPLMQTEMLTVIDEESDRLDRLIAQSVQMAQLDAHEVQMNLEPYALDHLFEDARQACASALAGHPVEVALPEPVPWVLADRTWIKHVLSNLLENAAKFSPAGSPIRVSARVSGGAVAVSVTDRGEGIEPAEQSLIFQKFYRGHKQRQHVPGTGMGLAICRSIIEAHQGSIDVQSEPGRGSTFTFTCTPAS